MGRSAGISAGTMFVLVSPHIEASAGQIAIAWLLATITGHFETA
jgi:hypothetical protein